MARALMIMAVVAILACKPKAPSPPTPGPCEGDVCRVWLECSSDGVEWRRVKRLTGTGASLSVYWSVMHEANLVPGCDHVRAAVEGPRKP